MDQHNKSSLAKLTPIS
uniref:Uncharacterized protein n=1 Tax=Arundo donax TaxID=35708 RepID=A0A0A8ZW40_ARUDO